jgi:hypothetical protein
MEFSEKTLALIQDTAVKSKEAIRLDLDDPRTAFIQHGDEIKQFVVPPPVRRHTLHSLSDLIAYAQSDAATKPVVWHGPDGVVLVMDDSDRRDLVTFPLTFSARYQRLRQLAADKPSFDQSRFVRLLRIELGLDNAAVVSKFRKLDWENGDKAAGRVQHGDMRLSKEVVAKVQGVDELPEEIRVPIPVYNQAGERQEYEMVCAVEIDTVNRAFQLIPLPDEIERVLDLAQDDIRKRLTGELETVYYGEP